MKEKGSLQEGKGGTVSRYLQQRVQQGHQQLAHRLGNLFNRCSRKRQLHTLIFFFLFCAATSTWVLIQSFQTPANPLLPIESIRQPAVAPFKKALPVFSPAEYDRLHTYRLHLDSLQGEGDTSRVPQRDTLLQLEQFYLQQLKK